MARRGIGGLFLFFRAEVGGVRVEMLGFIWGWVAWRWWGRGEPDADHGV